MTNVVAFSGFACNGKTTFLSSFNNKQRNSFLFTEHAGDCLEIGNELTGVWSDYLQFQTSLIASEYERLKFVLVNQKNSSVDLFLFDRNIIDILTFIDFHHKYGRIKSVPENLVSNVAKYSKDKLNNQIIFNKQFLIKPCKNENFIKENCLRKDRIQTIDFDKFIEQDNFWCETFKNNFNTFQSDYNMVSELIEIDHPANIGFDAFEEEIQKYMR